MAHMKIVEEFLEAWKANGRGEYQENTIKLKGTEEIIFVHIQNISVRENQITVTGFDNSKISRITLDGNSKFIWIGGFTNSDKWKNEEIVLDNYIFSIEPMDKGYVENDADSYDVSSLVKNACIYFRDNTNRGIYGEVITNTYNKFKAILIRIKDDNSNYIFDYFDNYVMSTDNRTYSKTVRNMTRVEYVVRKEQNEKKESENPYNLLVYGAPGTGKSRLLDKLIEEELEHFFPQGIVKNAGEQDTNVEINNLDNAKEYKRQFVKRITFYEDYSYENFVGCYKAKPQDDIREIDLTYQSDKVIGKITENKISYLYEPGPFIETYIKAKNDCNSGHNYYLFIEEINRAKAASVFGDMFQLLDREAGNSKYEITPEPALREYLKQHINDYKDTNVDDITMSLPSNMYIWATMNSADQGVFTLDSAFKRRWEFRYKDIVSFDRGKNICLITDGKPKYINWDVFRTAINDKILQEGFDEDRCIGAYYFSDDELAKIEEYTKTSDETKREKANPLVDKLLAYLRQDIFRMNPDAIFQSNDGKYNMSSIRSRVFSGEDILSILNINIGEVKGIDEKMKEWKESDATGVKESSQAKNDVKVQEDE